MSNQENIVDLPGSDLLEMEASEWFVRLADGGATPEELAAFYAWRDKSSRHRAAFDEFAALWGELDIVKGMKDRAAAARRAERYASVENRTHRWLPSRRVLAGALAASLVLAVGVSMLDDKGGVYQETFETAVGEHEQVTLRDGSVLELNTDTEIAVAFTKTNREIQLLRGEAYFDVAPNARKPFSVFAGEGVVTAVGTEFTVRLRDALVDVVVSEGRVALARRLPEAGRAGEPIAPVGDPLTELSVGQGALFDEEIERIDVVTPAALGRKLSWRNGILSFSGESLGEVVADVGRYTHFTIEIEDDALRATPVAGFFKIGDAEAMLEAIELLADARAVRVDEAHVRLVKSDK